MADARLRLRRLLRGGSWLGRPWDCRSAFRNRYLPVNAISLVGFRVVCLHQANDHTIQLEEQADG